MTVWSTFNQNQAAGICKPQEKLPYNLGVNICVDFYIWTM